MKDKKSFIDKIDELVAKLDERNPKNDFIFLAIMFCFVVLFMLFGGIFQTALSNSTKETQTFFTILFIVFLALPLIMTLYDKYQNLKANIKKLCEPKDFLQDYMKEIKKDIK